MPKSGLPLGVKMRHDSHYVDQIASHSRSVGRTIPISAIFPNPEQPRSEFGDLSELTASIKEKGVLEPLLVKPKPEGRFMIIAGERRWRASQAAGLTEVPCIELDIDDNSVAEIALIENLQRKDLTVWEEADGLASLVARFGYTHDQIALRSAKAARPLPNFLRSPDCRPRSARNAGTQRSTRKAPCWMLPGSSTRRQCSNILTSWNPAKRSVDRIATPGEKSAGRSPEEKRGV